MSRYAGKVNKLYPEDAVAALKVDQILDTVEEIIGVFGDFPSDSFQIPMDFLAGPTFAIADLDAKVFPNIRFLIFFDFLLLRKDRRA